jgi:hypothetical protein
MALTFTKVRHDVTAAGRLHTYDVTFDNSYAAGGMVVTPANFGLRGAIHSIQASDVGATAANNRLVTWNPTTSKLVIWSAIGTEAASASQGSVVARCLVYGDNVNGR